ncbi:MAG: S8 family serine peptidase [Flavobacteriales bacterium]|nr:S8 family serine peptidase [Flavobacteriales bacterium]
MHLLRVLPLVLFALCASFSHAQRPEAIPGDLLVMLKPGASATTVVDEIARLDGGASGLQVVREVSAPMRTWLLRFRPGTVPQAAMLGMVRKHPAVELAQNNHHLKYRALPNDDEFAQQWHHANIDSELAWDITTGGITATGDTIVVCIVENANLPHPDLIANAWFNHAEVPNNDIDDDNNGYVDDFQGWDADAGNDAIYGGSHGTQVAGMIGATGNNGSQVAGANWAVKMMVVANTGASDEGVIASHTYPLVMRRLYNATNGEKGAFVVATNASWGIDGGQPEDAPLWCAMYDTLGTAGILNCGATANNNVNIDVVGDLPTGCPSDFMISVTATNSDDQRTFSGYGLTTIDVGAPGADVLTTTLNGNTGTTSGTSFASPLTAGVIGLLYSAPCASLMDLVNADPEAGALYIRQALFNGVEQVGNLPGNTVTGGRINSRNSLDLIMAGCGACPVPYNLSAINTGLGTAVLNWSSTNDGSFNVRVRPVGASEWSPVVSLDEATYTLSDLASCTAYEFQVEAACDTTTSGFGSSVVFTSEGCCTAPLTITAAAVDSANATVTWSSVLAANTYEVRFAPQGTGAWVVLSGLSGASTALTGLEGCSVYEVQISSTCGEPNTSDWSSSVLFTTPGCGQCVDGVFCPSIADDASSEWIARVQLNTIDNASGSDDGYAAYTNQSTSLIIGQEYAITLTPGFGFFVFDEYWMVWIDLDADGAFESPDELVFDAGAVNDGPVNGLLTVPNGTVAGPTRMRVIMKYDAAPTGGCENGYDYGETEDYCVNLEMSIGVKESGSAASFTAYPNPADNALFIGLPEGASGLDVELLDGAGRTLARSRAAGDRVIIPIEDLANGLYLYRILDQGAVKAQGKFQVAHF